MGKKDLGIFGDDPKSAEGMRALSEFDRTVDLTGQPRVGLQPSTGNPETDTAGVVTETEMVPGEPVVNPTEQAQ